MEPERAPKSATQTKSKDLLRLQKAVYGLIDQPTDPKEKAVKNLMQKKQKPKFELPKQSSRTLSLIQSLNKLKTSYQ